MLCQCSELVPHSWGLQELRRQGPGMLQRLGYTQRALVKSIRERKRMKSKAKGILVAGLAVSAAAIGLTGYGVVAAGDQTAVQLATLSPADAIAERQKLMKDNGAQAKAINEYVESGTGTAADVATHAGAIKANAA